MRQSTFNRTKKSAALAQCIKVLPGTTSIGSRFIKLLSNEEALFEITNQNNKSIIIAFSGTTMMSYAEDVSYYE